MHSISDMSPILTPIIALSIPTVGIIAGVALKITRLQLLHETVRHISASGQPIPPELLNQLIDKKAD